MYIMNIFACAYMALPLMDHRIIMFFVLGFVPCYLVGWALKKLGMLRIPRAIELAGMDHVVMAQAEADAEELKQVELEFVRGG